MEATWPTEDFWEADPRGKLAFAGDWHRNSFWATQMIKYAAEHGADTIVQLGDFGFDFSSNFVHSVRYALNAHDVRLFFVDGNHDDHLVLWKSWPQNAAGFRNPPVGNFRERLNYIPRGKRWEWWGMKFLGLGGAHSVDRPWREPGISWWPTEMITEADIRRATDLGPTDIMVTHDLYETAPWPNDRKNVGWPQAELDLSRRNRLAVQAVVDATRPKLFLHGHYHIRYTNPHEDRTIIGLGMDGTSAQENLLIVDKEDLQRMIS